MTEILKNPLAWGSGVFGSMLGSMYLFADPFTLFVVFFEVVFSNATSLFTAFSILGFTIAPEVPALPTGLFKAAALVLGVIVVVKILDRVFDNVIERLD